MRKRMILLAGITMIGMSASAWAEEAPKQSAGDVIGGLIGSLLEDQNISETFFGEDGLLGEVFPEGFDLGGLKDLAGRLIGAIPGAGDSIDFGDFDLDDYFTRFDAMKEAIREYSLEKNSQSMDCGDAQILSSAIIYEDEDMGDELRVFAYVSQSNYTLDENALMFLSGSSVPVLFTLNWDEENGIYNVADTREAADGEEYTASLEEICAEIDYDLDECFDYIEYGDIAHMGDLVNYMNEHPEIEGIEFEGEIMNAEELNTLYSDRLFEYFSEPETDSAVTEVESVESAA